MRTITSIVDTNRDVYFYRVLHRGTAHLCRSSVPQSTPGVGWFFLISFFFLYF